MEYSRIDAAFESKLVTVFCSEYTQKGLSTFGLSKETEKAERTARTGIMNSQKQ